MWCKDIFYQVLSQWIVDTNLGGMDMDAYLSNPEELERMSNGFARRSNGVLRGSIDTIDG